LVPALDSQSLRAKGITGIQHSPHPSPNAAFVRVPRNTCGTAPSKYGMFGFSAYDPIQDSRRKKAMTRNWQMTLLAVLAGAVAPLLCSAAENPDPAALLKR